MKARTLILLISISLFPIQAKSFYGNDSAPMIKMMSLMMEMMSRLMSGPSFNNNSNATAL